jgi:4-carboxymuconolactone decarboxylase
VARALRRPQHPRIAPLATDERDAQARELLLQSVHSPSGVTGASEANIFTTLVRHPGLFRKWLPFGGKLLLAGKLEPRHRELLILRTAWRCGSQYEWAQHDVIGRTVGLSGEEVARVLEGPEARGWDPFDAAILRAADELHDDSCISDATWQQLAARLDDRQLIEVPMVVGHWHMVALLLNSLGVQLDPGLRGFH